MNINKDFNNEYLESKFGPEPLEDINEATPIKENEIETEVPFGPELVQFGVDKEHRYLALNAYTTYLVKYRFDLVSILEELFLWNRSNRPPLNVEEVVDVVCQYRDLYTTKGSRKKRKKIILSEPKLPSYLVERYRYRLSQTEVPRGKWFLELPSASCYGRWIIRRTGSQYQSQPLPCNQWWCLICCANMTKEWVSHLTQVSKHRDLYFIQANKFTVVKAINQVKANWVWVDCNAGVKAIIDSPIQGAVKVPVDKIAEAFETIASEASYSFGSVFASDSWRLAVKSKAPTTPAITVVKTWLPLYRQIEIAVSLEVKICGNAKWQLPKGMDAMEWEHQFTKEVAYMEESINKELDRLPDKAKVTARFEMHVLDINRHLWENQNQK